MEAYTGTYVSIGTGISAGLGSHENKIKAVKKIQINFLISAFNLVRQLFII
jgi:hypothetical protein